MSKLLKALTKSKMGNNRGTLNNVIGDLGVINPANFITGGSTVEINKTVFSVIVCLVLGGAGFVCLKTAGSLDQTNRKMVELSSLVTEQNRMIGVLSAMVKEIPDIHLQEVARLQNRMQEIEKTVAVNAEEMTEAVISNNLLKIAVDDLQSSEHVYVDQYIMLSRELKHIQEKINTEGRNL
ncbi:MAG: hypothetical protein AB7S78_03175 [Candidatus Omnitrophota bacterium]